jgi:hypothetical protein
MDMAFFLPSVIYLARGRDLFTFFFFLTRKDLGNKFTKTPGSVGQLVPNMDMKIIDVGTGKEVSSSSCFLSLKAFPPKNNKDFWPLKNTTHVTHT